MKKYFLFIALLIYVRVSAQTKILFDGTKAETANNADWIIDADLHNLGWNPNASLNGGSESNAQNLPTPLQNTITATTPETYWNGALSNWGIDLVKQGYEVETLPYNGQITFGNSSNAKDLSHYKVFIVCEPNILFTSTEKVAIIHFVQNGGGLFMISDHDQSDRNGDGQDSPHIWNNLMQSNTVATNPFGITFDYQNISQTTTNIANYPNDSILHSTGRNVAEMLYANGTTLTLDTANNASVKGLIYTTGSNTNGFTNCMVASATYGLGKIVALGDSSPCDDGTGDTGDGLYNGYTQDAAGNHQKLLINAVIWLATSNQTTSVTQLEGENNFTLYPNPTSDLVNIKLQSSKQKNCSLQVFNYRGELIYSQCVLIQIGTQNILIPFAAKGIYMIKVDNQLRKLVVE